MTRLKTAEPDLFKTPPPSFEVPAAQRAMALSLITILLTEAMLPPTIPAVDAVAMEADHDEDHA